MLTLVIIYNCYCPSSSALLLFNLALLLKSHVDLVVAEEVNEISLVRFKGYMASELMDSQLLDNLKDIELFGHLLLCISE